MKTKFILSGGYAGRLNKDNDKFFKEVLNTPKNNLRILLVYFAKDKSEYHRMQTEDQNQFNRNRSGKELWFEIAVENKFLAQTKSADIIYLHGGKTLTLLQILKRCKNLRQLLDGKIVAGESAGAYVLSSYFYSKSEGGIFQGLGYVPVKTICHYTGENAEKLADCPGKLETLLLPDYKFKVFEI